MIITHCYAATSHFKMLEILEVYLCYKRVKEPTIH